MTAGKVDTLGARINVPPWASDQTHQESEAENDVEVTPNVESPTSAHLARHKSSFAQHERSSASPFESSQMPERESDPGSLSVGRIQLYPSHAASHWDTIFTY